MSRSKIIKTPIIKNEVCFLTAPELDFADHELAASLEEIDATDKTAVAAEAESTEAMEDTGEASESQIDPEEVAKQLIESAQRQAEELLSTARQEADLLIAEAEEGRKQAELEIAQAKQEAEAESAQLKKAAYETGYQEGLAAGERAGEAAWAEKIAAAETTLEEAKTEALALLNRAEKERIDRIYESEEEILKLARDIAEKIISTELKDDPKKWLAMIGEAAQKVAGATELTICIAQEDEAFLIKNLKCIRSQFTESPMIQIKTDAKLKAGDFLLQSNMGEVDARIQQQLSKIFRALKEEGS